MKRLAVLMVAGMGLFAQTEAQLAESRRVKELMAAGRFADAVPLCERLVAALPSNAGLRLNLAIALHFTGEDLKAIPHFETVLKAQPGALPALMLLGASYLRTGQPAKAVGPLEKALALAPDDLQGRAMLADGLLMLERYAAAIPHLRKLAAADGANPRAWYGLGRAYEAVSQGAFESLEKLGQDSPYWLMLAAEVRLKLGRNTAAFTLYRAALAKQPGLRGAHAGLAEVYRKTNHPDWAATEEGLEKKQPAPACGVPTSECHFVKGRYEQALALALQRKTGEALYWQSRAANELARTSFEQLAKLPPSVESHQVMAELYRNQGRHGDAIREWKAALELAPGDGRLRQELATSLYMSRDYASAEKLARELLAEDPESPELHFIVGDSLVNLQQMEQALEPLGRAVKLRQEYPAAHAVLGRVLVQMGKGAEAIPHLRAALVADSDGSLHFLLGRAYQDAGQTELAAQTMKRYQEIRSESAAGEVEISGPPR